MGVKILVTGGAGFIGTSVVRHLLAGGASVVNLDKLTYAGSNPPLGELAEEGRYALEVADIADRAAVARILARHRPDAVMHLAAETHVDRSIDAPDEFIHSNLVGTFRLLEAARAYWQALRGRGQGALPLPSHLDRRGVRRARARGPLHRGDALPAEQPLFRQQGRRRSSRARLGANLRPAGGDHQLLQQLRTVAVSREADPADDPERARGQGAAGLRRRRQCARLALCRRPCRGAVPGAAPAGGSARPTISAAARSTPIIDLVAPALRLLDEALPDAPHRPHERLITFVADRPGHDWRYAMDDAKLRRELGWRPSESLESGIAQDGALVSRQPRLVGADPQRPLSRRAARRGRRRRGDEGHHAGRRLGHAALPADPRDLQAAAADLRQADGLLSAVGADAGRHPRHPGDHHADRRAALPRAARRWQPMGHRAVLRRAAAARRARPGILSAATSSPARAAPSSWATTSSMATGSPR